MDQVEEAEMRAFFSCLILGAFEISAAKADSLSSGSFIDTHIPAEFVGTIRETFFQDWLIYESQCLGISGVPNDPTKCQLRDYLGWLINVSAGYCIGEIDFNDPEPTWHLCNPDSFYFTRP